MAEEKSSALKPILITIVGGVLTFAIAGIAVGKISSAAAIRAALERVENKPGASAHIVRYNDNRNGKHYVCGIITQSGDNADGSKLFFVEQSGWFRSTEKAYIDGDDNFDYLYGEIACYQ